MSLFRSRQEALLEDDKVWESISRLAGQICWDANQTSAKIGITYRQRDDHVLITSRGAPAVALEVGTSRQPAKQHVKQALDRREK